MFTSQQEVKFWACRWAFARSWFRHGTFTINRGLQQIAMVNYATLLTVEFSHLFNVRLKQSGRAL